MSYGHEGFPFRLSNPYVNQQLRFQKMSTLFWPLYLKHLKYFSTSPKTVLGRFVTVTGSLCGPISGWQQLFAGSEWSIENRTSLESPGRDFNSAFSLLGFPGGSAGKESACNAGDPGLILGSERYARGGICYPPLYFWDSLVAQLVKNLPVVWETWV